MYKIMNALLTTTKLIKKKRLVTRDICTHIHNLNIIKKYIQRKNLN